MAESTIAIEQRGAAAWVWMNRPDVHNALNEEMIGELTEAFRRLGEAKDVRVIVLSGRGKTFCAGADIEEMKRQGEAAFEDNLVNARALAEMLHAMYTSPKPTIARVNGAAIGGGLGLVSVCDIAIAAREARFATSEVRLGLIPATIGPYVVRALGPRIAKKLFLTGERFGAEQAAKIGLIHEAAESSELDTKIEQLIAELLPAGPAAQAAAKDLIDTVAALPITSELIEKTATRIAEIRATDEAREGLSAFLQKRSASWVPHV